MNKKTSRTHREAVPEDLAKSLLRALNAPVFPSAWEQLNAARSNLADVVAVSNQELRCNPLAEIFAEHAMRQIGKRGYPRVVVDPDGTVMLEVHYDAPAHDHDTQTSQDQSESTRKSRLPPILELRAEATKLGLDPLPFKKNKTLLIEAINKARSTGIPVEDVMTPIAVTTATVVAEPTPTPAIVVQPQVVPTPVEPAKPKMTKTAPALTPVRIIEPDVKTVILDEDDDVASLFASPAPVTPVPVTAPSPRRGIGVATTPAVASPPKLVGGRSLSAIARNAETEINIETILATPAPPVPPEDD